MRLATDQRKAFVQKALKFRAARLGRLAAQGYLDATLAFDSPQWITTHPNGKGPKASGKGNKKGQHVLIESTTGEVLGGAGGKFNGKHITEMSRKNKQPEQAQHVILRQQMQRTGRLDDIQELGQQKRANARLTQENTQHKADLEKERQNSARLQSENQSLQEQIAQLKKQLEEQQANAATQNKEQVKAEAARELQEQQNQPKPQQIDTSLPDRIPEGTVLQNRSRANKASIEQMESIARSLDYYRVGTSNDFNSGCPVISFGHYDAENFGNKETLVMANGKHLDVQYAVVEAKDVLTSNRADGVARPEYFSEDPSQKRAIAGNGRMAAIQRSYSGHPNQASKYKQALIDNAAKHGCSPDVISGMKQPVLVRVMQPKDVTKDIGDQTNISQGMELNAVEQSKTDSQRVDAGKFEVYEDGTPTVDSVKKFIAALPKNEQAGLVTADGAPSRQAQDRLQNAMMMAGYGNEYLVRLRGQAINPDGKNLLNALCNASTYFAGLRKEGEAAEEYDISNVLNAVIDGFMRYTNHGKGSQFKWERDLFMSDEDNKMARDIAELVNANKRSGQRLTQIFRAVGESLTDAYQFKQGATSSYSLFEEVDRRNDVKTAQQAVSEALSKVREDFAKKDEEKEAAAARRNRSNMGLLAGLGPGFDSAQELLRDKRLRIAHAYALGCVTALRMHRKG